MKNLIVLILPMFFLYSCKNHKNEIVSESYVKLNDDLKEVVVRYIKYQPCSNCVFEIYFNKIAPDYTQIMLYKGNNSLTFNEYEKKGKFPVLYTEILEKKIYIYTGGEGYFKAPKNRIAYVNEKKYIKSFNLWVVSDSLNVRKIDTLDFAYPFFSLPVKVKFPSPF